MWWMAAIFMHVWTSVVVPWEMDAGVAWRIVQTGRDESWRIGGVMPLLRSLAGLRGGRGYKHGAPDGALTRISTGGYFVPNGVRYARGASSVRSDMFIESPAQRC